MKFFSILFGKNNNENLSKLVREGTFLADVRTSDEFSKGNAKGSINIPLAEIGANLDKFKGKEKIVVFCQSGIRSSQAKTILEQKGFTNVTSGGTWQDINKILKK